MKYSSVFVAILLATTIVATPAFSQQQRKTLLEVLFPKAYERRIEERRRLEEAKPKVLPKVKRTPYYDYKVVSFEPITIKPAKLEFAALADREGSTGLVDGQISTNSDVNVAPALEAPETTQMTKDLAVVDGFDLKAEEFIAAAVSQHYGAQQDYFWLNEAGEWNARARSVRKVMANAAKHGLEPQDYLVYAPAMFDDTPSGDASQEAVKAAENPADLADVEKAINGETAIGGEKVRPDADAIRRLRMEVGFSVAALRYAMDAEFGVINPNRLSGYHDFPVFYNKAGAMLDKLLSKSLPANTLRSFHLEHDKYLALKRELFVIAETQDEIIELPRNILIKPGMKDDALEDFVAAIRKRGSKSMLATHAVFLTSYKGEPEYSQDVVKLVKDYQKEAGLGVDGIIGRNTATKLAGLSSQERALQVKLAMERLRWMPNELGQRHVFINQPEYRARYINRGKEELAMRIVVGTRSNQTNFFYDEIEHVVYNPYWGVPRSIIINEFLPSSISNPAYLDQNGYEITTWDGKRISSTSIDWATLGTTPKFAVRQPPGEKNALGNIKIMFPNKHSIYMHDTPSKQLFERENRAFSHGCIRLQDPQAMAAAVLGKSKSYVTANIAKGKNETEDIAVKVPVYVSYFTAWPQKDGSVKYFVDMYGRDIHLDKAIKATRKVRDINLML